MFRAVEVKPRTGYSIWVRFSDGIEGEVDLSEHAGKGVFSAWDDRAFFEGVHIGEAGSIAWSELIELCPDSIYLKLTSKKPEEVFAGLRPVGADA